MGRHSPRACHPTTLSEPNFENIALSLVAEEHAVHAFAEPTIDVADVFRNAQVNLGEQQSQCSHLAR